MLSLVEAVIGAFVAAFRPRASLVTENLALLTAAIKPSGGKWGWSPYATSQARPMARPELP